MSDFAGELDIDANAIIDRLTEVKEAIQETFSGGKDLEFQFPQGAYTTVDMFPWQQQYKLQWARKKLVRYQSAYVTFTRAAINPLKGDKAVDTMIAGLKESEGIDHQKAKQLIANARSTAIAELVSYYKKKFQDLYDVTRNTPAEDQLIKAYEDAEESLKEARAEFHKAQKAYDDYVQKHAKTLNKHTKAVTKLQTARDNLKDTVKQLSKDSMKAHRTYKTFVKNAEQNLDWDAIVGKYKSRYPSHVTKNSYTPGELGQAVADGIAANPGNSQKLTEMFMNAVYAKANEQLSHTHRMTGRQGSLASNKMASQLAQAWYRSVVVAYEISYWLYEIDKAEARRRMQKQVFKLEEKKNEYKNKVNKDLKELLGNLTALQANPLANVQGSTQQIMLANELKDNLESEAKEILGRKKEIDEEYQKAKTKIGLDHAKIEELLTDDQLRAIGNFTIAPVGSRGKLRTGIKWNNTSASMSARVNTSAAGTVNVMLSFSESTKGLASFGHERHRDGFLTFKPSEELPDGDGDIGKQFTKLVQSYS